MQAIQNIAVINGRPSIWGDAMLALVQSHKDFEYITEDNPTGDEAVCIIKRRGATEHMVKFSIDDATKAGLNKKLRRKDGQEFDGIWQKYPKRMLQMRARAFACRDVFADALKGLHCAEEVMDYHPLEKNITPVKKSEKLAGLIEKIDSNETQEVDHKSHEDVLSEIKSSKDKSELVSLLPFLVALPEEHKIKAREFYAEKMKSFAEE
jgi:hypothetical protein